MLGIYHILLNPKASRHLQQKHQERTLDIIITDYGGKDGWGKLGSEARAAYVFFIFQIKKELSIVHHDH